MHDRKVVTRIDVIAEGHHTQNDTIATLVLRRDTNMVIDHERLEKEARKLMTRIRDLMPERMLRHAKVTTTELVLFEGIQ